MPIYAKVDKDTGEFHDNCGACGILSISGLSIDDEETLIFKETNSDEAHVLIEISSPENDLLAQLTIHVERDGKIVEVPSNENILDEVERKSRIVEPKYKLDINKATTDIRDREKEDDLSKPIEIEGPGGKEIIGYEQKPEPIVTVRQTGIEAAKQI